MNRRKIGLLLVSVILLSGSIFTMWTNDTFNYSSENQKINGVNFVSPRSDFDSKWMGSIKRINGQWISIVPYAFSPGHVPQVIFDHERQWWGETSEGTEKLIQYARAHDLKIMLKPHVWVRGDGWPGDFDLQKEDEWKKWELEYTAYVMKQAYLAAAANVEILCIGTEYRKAVVKRKEFWVSLIEQVRQVYKGEITYAANWDNYQKVTFWDRLDYIGIDAYFPLTDDRNPKKASLLSGWQTILPKLESFSDRYNKRVLFTEYGYQSRNYAAAGHWQNENTNAAINLDAQYTAYEALYESIWDQAWFAGGFLWKWYPDTSNSGGQADNRFTPQNKPAESIIKKWYGQ